MSGGSLNYAEYKINDIIDCLKDRQRTAIYKPLIKHLEKLALVLHEIEWHLSCDTTLTDDEITEKIKTVTTGDDITTAAMEFLVETKQAIENFEKYLSIDG